MKFALCQINILIPIPDNATDKEAQEIAENYELPSEYSTDSFEYLRIIEE
jgi:hypothetical protein